MKFQEIRKHQQIYLAEWSAHRNYYVNLILVALFHFYLQVKNVTLSLNYSWIKKLHLSLILDMRRFMTFLFYICIMEKIYSYPFYVQFSLFQISLCVFVNMFLSIMYSLVHFGRLKPNQPITTIQGHDFVAQPFLLQFVVVSGMGCHWLKVLVFTFWLLLRIKNNYFYCEVKQFYSIVKFVLIPIEQFKMRMENKYSTRKESSIFFGVSTGPGKYLNFRINVSSTGFSWKTLNF